MPEYHELQNYWKASKMSIMVTRTSKRQSLRVKMQTPGEEERE